MFPISNVATCTYTCSVLCTCIVSISLPICRLQFICTYTCMRNSGEHPYCIHVHVYMCTSIIPMYRVGCQICFVVHVVSTCACTCAVYIMDHHPQFSRLGIRCPALVYIFVCLVWVGELCLFLLASVLYTCTCARLSG